VTTRVFHLAQVDLEEGRDFYEEQAEGLGDYFLKCIFRDLEELERFAGIHEIAHGYHRSLSKKFPFAIYYLVRGDTLEIHAILDCRRDPAWIARRLDQ